MAHDLEHNVSPNLTMSKRPVVLGDNHSFGAFLRPGWLPLNSCSKHADRAAANHAVKRTSTFRTEPQQAFIVHSSNNVCFPSNLQHSTLRSVSRSHAAEELHR